jgi:hypothetical protein
MFDAERNNAIPWPHTNPTISPPSQHRQREAQAQLPPDIDDDDVTDLAIECRMQ